jgi:hypothetical protein
MFTEVGISVLMTHDQYTNPCLDMAVDNRVREASERIRSTRSVRRRSEVRVFFE